jgi:hypothetical protein
MIVETVYRVSIDTDINVAAISYGAHKKGE